MQCVARHAHQADNVARKYSRKVKFNKPVKLVQSLAYIGTMASMLMHDFTSMNIRLLILLLLIDCRVIGQKEGVREDIN